VRPTSRGGRGRHRCLIGLACLVGCGLAAARGRSLLGHPRTQQAFERLSGIVLVGLGVRLALMRQG
jgi:threonine/homoserine/homoserine lactone efflux protein